MMQYNSCQARAGIHTEAQNIKPPTQKESREVTVQRQMEKFNAEVWGEENEYTVNPDFENPMTAEELMRQAKLAAIEHRD